MFVTGSQQDKLFEYSLTSPFSLIDVSGEHSGDVINTSSTIIMIQTLTAILLQLLQLEQDQVRVQELMVQLVQL